MKQIYKIQKNNIQNTNYIILFTSFGKFFLSNTLQFLPYLVFYFQ